MSLFFGEKKGIIRKMNNNIFQKIINFAKKEKRLCTAIFFVVLIFLLNQLIFSSQKITSQDCLEGKCGVQEREIPQLSKDKNIFYQDDILTEISSGYYRLTFQAKTDKQESVLIKLNTYTEKNETIRKVSLENSEKFENHEFFFFLPEGYNNIIFEKENLDGEGNIFIRGVGVTKLNVDTPEEFALMRETIIGETTIEPNGFGQTEISSDSFSLLREPDTRFGQIFKAETEYISGIVLNMDIIQDKSIKDEDYKLSLQEVQCRESDCKLIGDNPFSKSFSIRDALERYQREDGTFLFPLYANVEKGKDYFVSIDNSKVKVSRRNYLDLKGGRNDDAYTQGSAGFKLKNNIYKIAGDLFFVVQGVNFDVRDGVRILNGAKIETLGKGEGKYTYVSKGEFVDILDLWSASPGTNFDEGRKVIIGSEKDSALVYEVNTIFPMEKIHFFAEQSKASWKKVKVEYSFDRENWVKISSLEKTKQDLLDNTDNNQNDLSETEENDSEEENFGDDSERLKEDVVDTEDLLQVFDFDVIVPKNKATIYFKITPDSTDKAKSRYFSIKNLRITADLKIE